MQRALFIMSYICDPPANVEEMLAHDAESATPGYECFGGPVLGTRRPHRGVAPGGLPHRRRCSADARGQPSGHAGTLQRSGF